MNTAAEAAAQPEVEEVVSDGLTLDLTNSHLSTLEDVPLAPTLTVSRGLWASTVSVQHVPWLAQLWPIDMQALDLTANRLTALESNLIALTGHPPHAQSQPARTNVQCTAESDRCFATCRIGPHSDS